MRASPGADVDDLEEAEEDDEEDAALGPSMDFAVSERRTIHRNPPLVHSQSANDAHLALTVPRNPPMRARQNACRSFALVPL